MASLYLMFCGSDPRLGPDFLECTAIEKPPAFFTDAEQPYFDGTIVERAFRWPWALVRAFVSFLHALVVLLRTIS